MITKHVLTLVDVLFAQIRSDWYVYMILSALPWVSYPIIVRACVCVCACVCACMRAYVCVVCVYMMLMAMFRWVVK